MSVVLSPARIAGAADTRLYLQNVSLSDMERIARLWKASRARFALNAVPASLSEAQKRAYALRVAHAARSQMRKDTQKLLAGTLLLLAWYNEMRAEMKAAYLISYYLAVGGSDKADLGIFFLLALPQFFYLDNFMLQMEDGRQPLNGTAIARAGLYGMMGFGFHQNAILFMMSRLGLATSARRMLGPTEDHCHDSIDRQGCIELADKGWMPIGDMVPIGDATCYSNCLCHIEYRK